MTRVVIYSYSLGGIDRSKESGCISSHKISSIGPYLLGSDPAISLLQGACRTWRVILNVKSYQGSLRAYQSPLPDKYLGRC